MIELNSSNQKQFSILFISFSADWHEDVWNVLSVESLAGDLLGFFGNKIHITTYRIFNSVEILSISDKIKFDNYDLICFSLDIGSHHSFFQLLKYFRTSNINIPIVCGGTLATYANDFLIENNDFLYLHPIIVLGDGELVLRNIINKLIENDKSNISNFNIMYYDNILNKYINSKKQPLDVSKLVYPPQHFIYNNKKHTVHILQTSRNCNFKCNYCTQGPDNKWFSLPIDRVKENIGNLFSNGVREFEFVDDEFFGGISSYHIDRAYKIADIIKHYKEKYNDSISFRIFTNPYVLSSKNEFINILEYLKLLGLSRVYLGIESGSEKQRKRYNRIDSISDCKNAINILKNLDITIDAGFIMFDPEMEVNELIENIEFIKENNLLEYNTWPLRPITITANTPLFHRILKLGLLGERSENNPASFNYKFLNPIIDQIFISVDYIAKKTSKIFYILKYYFKEHFYDISQIENIIIVNNYLKKNAVINLNFISKMVLELKENNSILESTNYVKQYLLELIYEIKNNINIFKHHDYSSNYLLTCINDTIRGFD